MLALTSSPKEQIILAAERLFAEHGIDGVSLRQIGLAAGNANNSAVQYHFGSKDQLIQAIFEHRGRWLHQRRIWLVTMRRPDHLRSWLECELRALLEQSELEGSSYMRFVAMLVQHRRVDVFRQNLGSVLEWTAYYRDQLRSFLTQISEPLRSHRIATAMAIMVRAAAVREEACARGQIHLPFEVELCSLLDSLVGFLGAPVSPETLAAVEGADPATMKWPLGIDAE